MPRPRRRNPWTSTGEILVWLLFVALLFPAGFAGWAVGKYTSLGKPPATVTVTAAGSTTPTSTSTPATTTSGGAAAGMAVFAANSCATCHTFTPAGASGTIGPNLDSAIAGDAKTDGNMPLAAFIKQSITDPNAYIAKGFTSNIMPQTFGTSIKPSDLNALVAFILAGTSKS